MYTPSHAQVIKSLRDSELGDGQLFSYCFKDGILYEPRSKERGVWYLYDTHWSEDTSGQIYNLVATQYADLFIKAAVKEAESGEKSELADELWSHASYLKTERGASRVLFWASKQEGMTIQPVDWDSDPYLLGVQNGVINLRDQGFTPSKPSQRIKGVAPVPFVGFDSPCPRWQQFLLEIFNQDTELVDFMHRLLGYAISGLTVEHIFPLLCGQGRNGKTLMIETVNSILGYSLSGPVQAEILLDSSKNPNAASPHLLDLVNRRLSFVNETNEGWLNSASVKALTGGDTIVARPLYGDPIRFKPKHKIFLVTNYRPRADADDYALWQRVKVIEFPVSFVDDPRKDNERKADKFLRLKLQEESKGILGWLACGFLQWQEQGLNPPDSVKLAVEKYREGEDNISLFIKEQVSQETTLEVKASTLYDSYKSWVVSNGLRPLGSRKFYHKISSRFSKEERMDGNYYLGICPRIDYLNGQQSSIWDSKNGT
jgi:putative DNA primase/helicase